MNPSLVQAAREISARSHQPFEEVLRNLKAVWTDLTGQPVYLHAIPSENDGISVKDDDASLEDFV